MTRWCLREFRGDRGESSCRGLFTTWGPHHYESVSCSCLSFILIIFSLCVTCFSVSPVCFSLSVFFHSLPHLSFSLLTPPVPDPLVSVAVYLVFVLSLSDRSVMFPLTPSWSAFRHVVTQHSASVFPPVFPCASGWYPVGTILVSYFWYDLTFAFLLHFV